jgi:hypothetical protein
MENINTDCVCVNEKCERHGKCSECQEYHKGKSFCELSPKVQGFIIRQKQKSISNNSGERRT